MLNHTPPPHKDSAHRKELAKKRVVVMVSGTGSNLAALIKAAMHPASSFTIVKVISNRQHVLALQKAEDALIECQTITRQEGESRQAYDQRLHQAWLACDPDFIVLAGFLHILTAQVTKHWEGKLMNIHPSLLPAHKGLHTHQRALAAGDKRHGCTVHAVSEELDGGPLLLQASLAISPDDDEAHLAARVLRLEHRLYPLAIEWLAKGKLRYKDGLWRCEGVNNLPLIFSENELLAMVKEGFHHAE